MHHPWLDKENIEDIWPLDRKLNRLRIPNPLMVYFTNQYTFNDLKCNTENSKQSDQCDYHLIYYIHYKKHFEILLLHFSKGLFLSICFVDNFFSTFLKIYSLKENWFMIIVENHLINSQFKSSFFYF